MTAYHWVYGFGHLLVDCRGPRSALKPYACFECGTTLLFLTHKTTDRDLVEGSGHHGDQHVEEDDDGAPVVDAEYNVAETLREPTLISPQFHRPRLFQSEHRPVDRAERVLKAAETSQNHVA